ncbi:hypothetical protein KGF56_002306 [Candida oxycetoniae]|uniref:Electron transfer flavoprotein-ubiquinone oxidoreductase n=1 Tax=Candida oxycetoniae TaxID=497107 RepID=A0AAI9SY74_9ASCO|nr:uncharacterized protein KGF56_002306 [Candida oxycetoniae]KAI3404890.2 hypothetical protein KGF56_002306 [Candida oxycetoniae]
MFRVLRRKSVLALSYKSAVSRGIWKRPLSTPPPPLASCSPEQLQILNQERVRDEVDVCIVGGGPAGLATAIKLKQLDNQNGSGDMRVVVLEKAADFGGHTVSGAVIEPQAFRELFPDSSDQEDIPLPEDLVTKVTSNHMKYLTKKSTWSLPEPPQLSNKGNYIVSLNTVVKYLSEQAEELGVELYSGVAVSEVLYDKDDTCVIGVATQDMGIDSKGRPKPSFERGLEFTAQTTVFAEGCHGSLTKQLIKRFNLRKNSDPQTYGLGIKEVWEVNPEKFKKGYVSHTLGYPLTKQSASYGGGFMYHFGNGLVAVGLVIGLDYKNPYISPYFEFQKMKHHPYYSNVLTGGKCISFAARTLVEGGIQSLPKLEFNGGLLVGDGAGFLNVCKIKGTHTAIRSGIIAAKCIYNKKSESELEYESKVKRSSIYDELHSVRNVRPSFNSKLGVVGGMAYSGFTTTIKGKEPWTLQFGHGDAAATQKAQHYAPIEYPKPDGVLSYDIATSVSRTGTMHRENQPSHLYVENLQQHAEKSWPAYKGVEERFCPAGVYEYVEDKSNPLGVEFRINSQNCIHCKTCDIKTPTQDITWKVPEGGDGPNYYMT